jgi:hypothetical protein
MYITITALQKMYGSKPLKLNAIVKLVKEPDNKYDKEAILVKLPGLGGIGHVANSVNTVMGECYSAGRLYEHFKKKAKGKVVAVTSKGAVCEFRKD